ncbi:hypothetical protein OSTOST_00817, partial [Ostertagia ostertagi]
RNIRPDHLLGFKIQLVKELEGANGHGSSSSPSTKPDQCKIGSAHDVSSDCEIHANTSGKKSVKFWTRGDDKKEQSKGEMIIVKEASMQTALAASTNEKMQNSRQSRTRTLGLADSQNKEPVRVQWDHLRKVPPMIDDTPLGTKAFRGRRGRRNKLTSDHCNVIRNQFIFRSSITIMNPLHVDFICPGELSIDGQRLPCSTNMTWHE